MRPRGILRKMKAIRNIGVVTKAMELVSISKAIRAEEAALRSRQVVQVAEEILASLRHQVDFLGGGSQGKPVIVAITPDRGKTGGQNTQLLLRMEEVNALLGGEALWVAIGKKGIEYLEELGRGVLRKHLYDPVNPDFTPIRETVDMLVKGFCDGEYVSVHLVYATFENSSKWSIVSRRFLPVEVPDTVDVEPTTFSFEPDPETVAERLLELLIVPQVYVALLESQAAEYIARRIAMHNATKAAEDWVAEMGVDYNRARQGTITNQLLDLIGGLGGGKT